MKCQVESISLKMLPEIESIISHCQPTLGIKNEQSKRFIFLFLQLASKCIAMHISLGLNDVDNDFIAAEVMRFQMKTNKTNHYRNLSAQFFY